MIVYRLIRIAERLRQDDGATLQQLQTEFEIASGEARRLIRKTAVLDAQIKVVGSVMDRNVVFSYASRDAETV